MFLNLCQSLCEMGSVLFTNILQNKNIGNVNKTEDIKEFGDHGLHKNWKQAGALARPNGMIRYSQSLHGGLKAVFHSWPNATRSKLKTVFK